MAEQMSIFKTVKIGSPMGLHARPAAQIVHLANRFKAELKLRRSDGKGSEADCRSVLAMLMLAACKDTDLILRGCGDDAVDAVELIAGYFERNFDEN